MRLRLQWSVAFAKSQDYKNVCISKNIFVAKSMEIRFIVRFFFPNSCIFFAVVWRLKNICFFNFRFNIQLFQFFFLLLFLFENFSLCIAQNLNSKKFPRNEHQREKSSTKENVSHNNNEFLLVYLSKKECFFALAMVFFTKFMNNVCFMVEMLLTSENDENNHQSQPTIQFLAFIKKAFCRKCSSKKMF